jgi:hypothetical protein
MALPKITLTAGTSPTEGLIGTYLITLDSPAPEGGLTVSYNTSGGTAKVDKDYHLSAGENLSAVTAGSFTIAAGVTTATLNLVAVADTVVDPDETVVVNITTGTGYDFVGNSSVFAQLTSVEMGRSPKSVISADFNGDGNVDLAATNARANTVSVRLGDGSGGFTGNTTVAVGRNPGKVMSADFNGDGNADLAIANYHDNTVSVLLGDGSGGFTAHTTVAEGRPTSLISADFNGDGHMDLATSNSDDNIVSVYLGNGSGGFTGATNVALNGNPSSLISADFNGDGNADLATANYTDSSVSVRLGNGSGGFTGATNVALNGNPSSLISADFNGDGNVDLATANAGNGNGNGTVSVRLGDGRGGFTGNTSIAVGSYPSIISADFNGDGNADLANANAYDQTVSVRLGNGSGEFTGDFNVAVGKIPWSIISADFNGDSKADLAVTGYRVSVLLNAGNAINAELTIADDGLYLPLHLYGDAGGEAKNDVLNGGIGADYLYGGAMEDTLSGGRGNDSIVGSDGNDILIGNQGNDRLIGGINHDKLHGNKGNDILDGGEGRDVLTGGSGSDIFRFTSLPVAANADKITDFSVVNDRIQLENDWFNRLTTGALKAANFVTAAAAHDSNDYVIYNPATGALLYDADGSGAGAAVRIALLGVDLALTSADIVVI